MSHDDIAEWFNTKVTAFDEQLAASKTPQERVDVLVRFMTKTPEEFVRMMSPHYASKMEAYRVIDDMVERAVMERRPIINSHLQLTTPTGGTK